MDRDRHRRDRDRDTARDSRRRRNANPEEDSDSPPPATQKPKRTGLQEYWIDGSGINREVLQRQICFMLGNEARSKPDVYNGVPGFRVSAVRPFTDKQLEDLIEISEEYEKERRETQRKDKRGYTDFSYDQSKTKERYNHPDTEPSSYREEGYGYPGRSGPPEGFPAGMPPYAGHFGQPSGHSPGYPALARRPSPPLVGAQGYQVPGYPEGRTRGFPDHQMRGPESGPPYQYGGDPMELDSGTTGPYRAGGYPRAGQPPGYGIGGGMPPQGYNMGPPSFGGQPNANYMNQPEMTRHDVPRHDVPRHDIPRNVPSMDPPGRQPRMPPDYEYGSQMSNYDRGPDRKDKPRYYDDRKR